MGAESGSPAGSPGKPPVSPAKGIVQGHAMLDPSESDERNPDIIPDQIDGDIQVRHIRFV